MSILFILIIIYFILASYITIFEIWLFFKYLSILYLWTVGFYIKIGILTTFLIWYTNECLYKNIWFVNQAVIAVYWIFRYSVCGYITDIISLNNNYNKLIFIRENNAESSRCTCVYIISFVKGTQKFTIDNNT